MNIYKTIKQFLFVAALVLGTIYFNSAEALAATTTVTELKQNTPIVARIGYSDLNLYNVTNLKINGKSIKKMKKKVKTVATDVNQKGFYFPASYYTSSSAYANYAQYKQAQENYSYKAAYTYNFYFKKTGTYTITYDTYSYDRFFTDVPGQNYQSLDTKIVKTSHTLRVKIQNSITPITSIKLGKSKWSSKSSNTATSTSNTSVVNRYLTGSNGKLSIKANKNYSITSIIVVTYNQEGEPVYNSVRNNQKINYGQFIKNSSYVSSNGVNTRISKSIYKPTEIYVGYKNNFTGAYTIYTVKTRNDGSTYVEYQDCYANSSKIQTGIGLNGYYDKSYVFYKK